MADGATAACARNLAGSLAAGSNSSCAVYHETERAFSGGRWCPWVDDAEAYRPTYP